MTAQTPTREIIHELCMSGHGWALPCLSKEPLASSRRLSSGKVGVVSVTASLSLWALPGLSYRHLVLPALHWVLLRLG